MSGLILSAAGSGSGKTTITLGLLRALRNLGVTVRSAKSGPDYIDPRFHAAASGADCVNLDAWAMQPDRIRALAAGDTPLIIEGAMGLFDGAPPDGKGATADLARILQVPVVLVLDVSHQAQSVAAVATGFANLADFDVTGVILNKVGSERHERMLRAALEPTGLQVFGVVYRNAELHTPSRHLGLVQAEERADLEGFLDLAAGIVSQSVDIDGLVALAQPLKRPQNQPAPLPPPAQSIAVARDAAFAFAYPHLLQAWREAGAEITLFSPLANEAPGAADLVILPGGYPELHAGRLAGNAVFLEGLRAAPAVYGECGGYMVLGDGLVDADGTRHRMAGLLRLETSFEKRRLHLGYRSLTPLGRLWDAPLAGHEFHYATTLKAEGDALFAAADAEGVTLADMGLRNGSVSGSFAHVIDWVV
ncbi:MAG: cobyrinate a,c-diamide synthase [Rhodobacteraceae bacterium]|nr:cobyrinate a,c-diamide synthase [Paracoccaceae bacterium]